MRKGRSGEIAGYEVWLGYEYHCDGEQGGLYRTKEMESKEEAEKVLRQLANRHIVVRIHPRRPSKSRVLDEDLASIGVISVSEH